MGYAVVTHICGAVAIVTLLAIAVLVVHAIRGLIAHRAAESAALARGTQTTVWFLGFTLPTLLRISSTVCAICAFSCSIQALVANWLFVDPVQDYGLRYASPIGNPADLGFTPAGQLCMTLAKLGPPGYVVTKAWSYVFFFLKSRTAVPKEKMQLVHKGVLFLTLQMFTFAMVGVWLIVGDASRLDGTCSFHVPPWMVILMGGADAALSSMYCVLFIAPLAETIKANRAMRNHAARVAPASTIEAGSGGGGQSLATANARGSALEMVMRRNLHSCVLTILSTAAAMSFIVTAHLIDDPTMRKINWPLGTIDLFVTCLSIAHLMHNSGPAHAAAAGGATAAVGAHGEAYKPAAATPAGGLSKGSGHGSAGAGPAVVLCINGGAESSMHSAVSPVTAGRTVVAATSPANGNGAVASAQLEPRDAPTPMHNGFMTLDVDQPDGIEMTPQQP